MNDDHHEDTGTVPDISVTAHHPRVRTPSGDRTRLDPHGLYDIAEPTRLTPPPRVSAPGTHTVGAPAAVDQLNLILDRRDTEERLRTAGRTRARVFRRRRAKALTLREAAEQRAVARLRHERHMEHLETVKAYIGVACMIGLLLLVIAMGVVAFMILSGQMTWAPTRV